LPIFLEFKEELHSHLGLKKHQLFKIMNGKNTAADKFVSMADIELLLMPEHGVRQRLQLTKDAADTKTADTAVWLADYLIKKYALPTKAKQSADSEA
jgi:hypothetical protein